MKLKIYSDIHADINKIITPSSIFEDDLIDYYLDAGDTGELDTTLKFYNDSFWNNKKVIAVAGNHTYYNTIISDTDKRLKSLPNNIKFLNNEIIDLDDKWSVIGTTLWTDFNVFGEAYNIQSKLAALRCMNDYRYIVYENKMFHPNTSELLFKQSLDFIQNSIKENRNYIILTHHAPSLISAGSLYKSSLDTSAFCNNLENFILSHVNIKLWIHGHCHNNSDYNIGDCRVICNPYGYIQYNENQFDNDLIIQI